jgi:hypothetical protein
MIVGMVLMVGCNNGEGQVVSSPAAVIDMPTQDIKLTETATATVTELPIYPTEQPANEMTTATALALDNVVATINAGIPTLTPDPKDIDNTIDEQTFRDNVLQAIKSIHSFKYQHTVIMPVDGKATTYNDVSNVVKADTLIQNIAEVVNAIPNKYSGSLVNYGSRIVDRQGKTCRLFYVETRGLFGNSGTTTDTYQEFCFNQKTYLPIYSYVDEEDYSPDGTKTFYTTSEMKNIIINP